MLEILLTPKILGPSKSGALGLSLFRLMVHPRLLIRDKLPPCNQHELKSLPAHNAYSQCTSR